MAANSLVPATVITAAGTVISQVWDLKANQQKLPLSILAAGVFAYGSGGTTCKVFIQTSVDNSNWFDVMTLAFTTASDKKVGAVNRQAAVVPVTPTDGTLADNTKNDGFVGRYWRAKIISTGTYGGNTTLTVDLIGEG